MARYGAGLTPGLPTCCFIEYSLLIDLPSRLLQSLPSTWMSTLAVPGGRDPRVVAVFFDPLRLLSPFPPEVHESSQRKNLRDYEEVQPWKKKKEGSTVDLGV